MEQAIVESNNTILLRGIVTESPEYSHENHGRRFWKLALAVPRLSGVRDTINVLCPETLLESMTLAEGDLVEVQGEIRSYHNRTGQGRRLIISVYASAMAPTALEPDNQVCLRGRICREPVYRRTPLGREICDVMLAVERKYGRRDFLPCILWGSLARMAASCPPGTVLDLWGRLQSRTYIKQLEHGSEERTAFEISAITAGIES